MHQVSS